MSGPPRTDNLPLSDDDVPASGSDYDDDDPSSPYNNPEIREILAAQKAGWNALGPDNHFDDQECGGEGRHFNPNWLRMPNPRLTNCTVYDQEKGITKTKYKAVRFPEPRIDNQSAVVQIYGTCKNKNSSVSASYGVYHGPSSPFNIAAKLPSDSRQTANTACLEAAIRAVRQHKVDMEDVLTMNLYLATDSDYLVRGMSKFLVRWRDHKFKGIVNGALWKTLDSEIREIEGELGLHVSFWKVDTAEIQGAVQMAEEKLTV